MARKLKTREAAERLGKSPATLQRWRRAGAGPPCKRIGGEVMYDEAELAEWIEQAESARATVAA